MVSLEPQIVTSGLILESPLLHDLDFKSVSISSCPSVSFSGPDHEDHPWISLNTNKLVAHISLDFDKLDVYISISFLPIEAQSSGQQTRECHHLRHEGCQWTRAWKGARVALKESVDLQNPIYIFPCPVMNIFQVPSSVPDINDPLGSESGTSILNSSGIQIPCPKIKAGFESGY